MGKLIGFERLVIEAEEAGVQRGDQWILHPFNWQLRQQQHTAVLGLNGSGKSILTQLLIGERWPSIGKIRFLRHETESASRENLRLIQLVSIKIEERIGYDTRVEDVVISGIQPVSYFYEMPTDSMRQQAVDALVKVDCGPLVHQCFGPLSLGEKIRVLMARALISSPTLLVLEEPTNGLDPIAREKMRLVLARLATERGGPTMILITHKIEDILPEFGHTLLLHQGHVVHQGITNDILTDQKLSETWQVPVHVHWMDQRPILRIQMK